MTKTMSAGAVLLLALSLACCQKRQPSFSKGEAYYKAMNCQLCHKIAGRGGRGGQDLTFVGFRHNKEWLDLWLKDPQSWKKGTLMPNPQLSAPAREAISEYLMTLRGRDYRGDQAPRDKSELGESLVKKGRLIYARMGCGACHGQNGEGGYPNNNVPGGKIPGLGHVSQSYSREELKRKIRNGVIPEKIDPRGPTPLISMPAWGEVLKEDEIEALAEYLLTLKSSAPSGDNW